jgi:hypothetical protein
VCSGLQTLTGSSGEVTDGSEGEYSGDLDCSWLINTGSATTLTFTSFDMEQGYDFVKVYDGDSASAPLLANLHGSQLPSPVTASSGKMFIRFETDGSVHGNGFHARYATGQASPTSQTPAPSEAAKNTATSECSGRQTLTASSGSVTEGSAGDYANDADCSWLIAPSDAMGMARAVTLRFSSFDLEADYDFLKVYDGDSENSPLLKSLHGSNMPAPITAASGKMFLSFTTDGSVASDGFAASYST